MNRNLILVDEQDNPIGEASKVDAHLGEAVRHRAFTAILKNEEGKILVARRSLKKPLWPTFWDLSFSSHPFAGESLGAACQRRAREEIGVQAQGFEELFSYEYHQPWNEVFSEWEINHIMLADYTGDINPNPEEVSEEKWVTWNEFLEWFEQKPEDFAIWVKPAVERLKAGNHM